MLLGRNGVTGFKTGHTATAGPCLCMTYNISGYKLAITLLKSRTPEKRWIEVTTLVDWAVNQLDIQIVFQQLSSLFLFLHFLLQA